MGIGTSAVIGDSIFHMALTSSRADSIVGGEDDFAVTTCEGKMCTQVSVQVCRGYTRLSVRTLRSPPELVVLPDKKLFEDFFSLDPLTFRSSCVCKDHHVFSFNRLHCVSTTQLLLRAQHNPFRPYGAPDNENSALIAAHYSTRLQKRRYQLQQISWISASWQSESIMYTQGRNCSPLQM